MRLTAPMSASCPILGAHMSMAGGFHRAIERGQEVGCRCVQIFVTNNTRWQVCEIQEEAVQKLRTAVAQYKMEHLIGHSGYLINLATPDAMLWKKSLDALVVELHRAARLGIRHLVLHPGAYTTSSETAGLRRVVRALNEVHRQTSGLEAGCLLENTAGQGTCLGWRFEQLAFVLNGVRAPQRLGVCLDTCHAFAAGYAFTSESEYCDMMQEFDRVIGFDRLKAIHVNDSKRERGSRVDRHEHIGRGSIGLAAFRHLLNDPRLRHVPMYLETPKAIEPRSGKPWDVINLRRLRRLVRR